LDVSSRTSVVLTKIIFREFLGFEPEWRSAEPNVEAMLDDSDCALLIGDPALSIADCGLRIAELSNAECGTQNAKSQSSQPELPSASDDPTKKESAFRVPHSALDKVPQSAIRKFDLVELWRRYTDLGFVFAMWMTRTERSPVDFSFARDEGLARIDEIVSNYLPDIKIGQDEFRRYLTENISYTVNDELQRGMELYFDLANKHRLCDKRRELRYAE
jgi:chorismate dehydratase